MGRGEEEGRGGEEEGREGRGERRRGERREEREEEKWEVETYHVWTSGYVQYQRDCRMFAQGW